MYMAFEGIFGTTWAWGVRGDCFEDVDAMVGVLGGPLACVAIRVTASGVPFGRGGGKGDIDMAETEAVWAWYTRRG